LDVKAHGVVNLEDFTLLCVAL